LSLFFVNQNTGIYPEVTPKFLIVALLF